MRSSSAPGARPPLAQPLHATLDALQAAAPQAQIVVVGPVPELPFLPPDCVAQARHLHRDERVCWSTPANLPLSRTRPAEAEIRAALTDHPAVRAVFPAEQLCTRGACITALDRRLIYFDDDHLSASGARRLAPGWLDQALGGRP